MAVVHTGKLIIHRIPNNSGREHVVDFLCQFAKGTSREIVASRLEKLPLTLGNAIPLEVGNKICLKLKEIGAEAEFVSERKVAAVSKELEPANQDQPLEPVLTQKSEKPAIEKSSNPAQSKLANETNSVSRDIRSLLILLPILVVGLCTGTLAFMPELKAASDPDLLLNKFLKKNAIRSNKTCPRTVNPELRLDGFEAGNKKMIVRYTLVNFNASDVNGYDLRPRVSGDIRHGLCRETNSAELLKQGVAFVFAVHGKDGGLIFDYQVVHEDCEY